MSSTREDGSKITQSLVSAGVLGIAMRRLASIAPVANATRCQDSRKSSLAPVLLLRKPARLLERHAEQISEKVEPLVAHLPHQRDLLGHAASGLTRSFARP